MRHIPATTLITVIFTANLALAPVFCIARNLTYPTRPYDLTHARVYSNICVDKRTGDLLGLRIFVREQAQKPRVIGQYAEGELEAPEPAQSKAELGQSKLTLPGNAFGEALSVEIQERDAVIRSNKAGAKPFRLLLQNDTVEFPDCR